MMFQSDLEIRKQLGRYLTSEISFEDFEDWFVAHSWNYHEAANLILLELVSEIELLLAEFSSGHWTEDDLKERLRPFITSFTIDYSSGSTVLIRTLSGSSVSVSPLSPDLSDDIQVSRGSA